VDLLETVERAALDALREVGRETLRRSRDMASRISDDLARSGSGREIPDGFEVRYRAPYASFVELGTRPGEVRVRAHVRRVNGRSVPVRAYSYRSRGRPAARFVRGPADESMERILEMVARRIERWS
jgi:hypothetical protein